MRLRVGSWPGFGDHHNKFLELFLKGLRDAGCDVTSINTIGDFPDNGLDILILHWAEKLFWEARDRWDILVKLRALIRQLQHVRPSTKVVWLVHNLYPHEVRTFKKMVWPFYVQALARNVDAALTLSPGTVSVVREQIKAFQHKPVEWVWHPSYPKIPNLAHHVAAARDARGWDVHNHVFGYCGQLRPYKGIEDLLDVFTQTKNSNWRLLVAGRAAPPHFQHILEAKAVKDPRVHLEFADLSEIEYETAILCCNTIVAPFRKYLHSGSLVHALSIGQQILTPSTPFSDALAKHVGQEWVSVYDGRLTKSALQMVEGRHVSPSKPEISDFDPIRVGKQALTFFQSL